MDDPAMEIALVCDVERLIMDAPGDTRRVLRRFAKGDLGRLPGLEALGGWHHLLGEAMIVSGIVGMVIAAVGAMRRDHGYR